MPPQNGSQRDIPCMKNGVRGDGFETCDMWHVPSDEGRNYIREGDIQGIKTFESKTNKEKRKWAL